MKKHLISLSYIKRHARSSFLLFMQQQITCSSVYSYLRALIRFLRMLYSFSDNCLPVQVSRRLAERFSMALYIPCLERPNHSVIRIGLKKNFSERTSITGKSKPFPLGVSAISPSEVSFSLLAKQILPWDTIVSMIDRISSLVWFPTFLSPEMFFSVI